MNQPEIYDKVMAINVDVQNDFCPGGALGVNNGDEVVTPLNKVNEWVRNHNGPVVFTADWHPRQTAHFQEYGGPWPPHCIRYTAGAALHNNLYVGDKDTVALKGMSGRDDGYSGWFARLLPDSPLYRWGDGRYSMEIESVGEAVVEAANSYRKNRLSVAVLIGGLATDYCVRATVLDALKRAGEINTRHSPAKIGVYVLRDAIRAVNIDPLDGDKAIEAMRAAGAQFVSSQEVVRNLVVAVRH